MYYLQYERPCMLYCLSDSTRTRMLQMDGETLPFYGLIGKVILKIHLYIRRKIKVKVYENQENSVSGIQTPSRS